MPENHNIYFIQIYKQKKAYPKIPTYQKPTFLYFQIYKQKQRCNKKTINQEPKSFQLCWLPEQNT